ncbi:YqgQ family protein [Aliicoccus persicus]|uniref:YqgQ family protein n=1 Tax=Aliicoccus persicus TaxID=930138 RepID=A0A662Z2I8_9STAP|nr:YqgQ family protein [Aliicoccus persicus]SEV84696.1 Uncharacterized protein YqgQ [Aliicoccus persicus]HJE18780.1 YqgQ family protein [Aliicoccus persicus]
MNKDLTYINRLLLRYGIYVYDKNEETKIEMMKLEIRELYRNQLISKEEFIESLTILRNRGV